MSDKVKRIDVKEFREKGYLLEVNRNFLHPLGLALEVIIDEDGNEKLGGIWDYRDDPEGLLYTNEELVGKDVAKKVNRIKTEYTAKAKVRKEKYGWVVQPIGRGKT